MDDPRTILNAYMDGELTEGQHRDLVAWMRQDPDNVERLIAECYLHSQLQDVFKEDRIAHDAMALRPRDSEESTVIPPSVPHRSAPPLLFGDAATSATGYLASGWPVAYLVATVVLGLGLMVGSLVQVAPPIQTIQYVAVPSYPSESLKVVGRITGMVDCVWDTEGSELRDWGLGKGTVPKGQGTGNDHHKSHIRNHKSPVAIGDTLALRSGLLELTYDTGAKVILQGPVTYEVDSAAGGYLSVGKLTAKLEKKAEDQSLPSPVYGRGAGGEGGFKLRSVFYLSLNLLELEIPVLTSVVLYASLASDSSCYGF